MSERREVRSQWAGKEFSFLNKGNDGSIKREEDGSRLGSVPETEQRLEHIFRMKLIEPSGGWKTELGRILREWNQE